MSAVRVTFGRTFGRLRNLYSTAWLTGCFLAVSAVSFALNLESADGGSLPLAVVWTAAMAPLLPALAAFLAMDVWCEERQSGRMAMLLTVAVREREYVLGKFFGVVLALAVVTLTSLAVSLSVLWLLAPTAFAGATVSSFVLSLAALAVQSLLWCAVAVAFGALFHHAAAAVCVSLVSLVVLPRGVWAGLMYWSENGRAHFGEMPLDAHAVDMASGVFPVGTVVCYLLGTALALFVATKCVVAFRLVGRGGRVLRLTTALAVLLSGVLAFLAVLSAWQFNPVLELSSAGAMPTLAPRTRTLLAESEGNLTITCFLPRSDGRYRAVSRFLRLLQRESASLGGTRVTLRFVDPRWDIGASERMVRKGIAENSLVFEKGRRLVSVPLQDAVSERQCASAIRRVAAPPQRRKIYWTVGHGEVRSDDYGAFGMSDIAREIAREGFSNATIDLSAGQQIPDDCALILIAGVKNDFSRAELGRLDAYLRDGGRLMVLFGAAKSEGLVSMLSNWGMRPSELAAAGGSTLSGSDMVVSDFTDHKIGQPLKGSRIILEKPMSFVPSAAAETGTGADQIGFSSVAEVGPCAVVAVVERGGGTGSDIALRPTRIVAVGDEVFVMNAPLAAQASANRDFFLNCVEYLAGVDTSGTSQSEADRFSVGLDRTGKRRLVLWSAAVLPGIVFVVLFALAARRRHRS